MHAQMALDKCPGGCCWCRYKGLAARAGYPTFPAPMSILALMVPMSALWFKIMDPIGEAAMLPCAWSSLAHFNPYAYANPCHWPCTVCSGRRQRR